MKCPYCGQADTQVKDSRSADDDAAIRRRRVCAACGGRFTTFERMQLRELNVVKRSGRIVPFDREKIARSVAVALRKRPVPPAQVDALVDDLVRRVEQLGEAEVPSERIGALVMEALRGLDDVAYVRFASVYRNFREARDFERILGSLDGEPPGDDAPAPRRAAAARLKARSGG